MKNECNVIRDLLPLYAEDMVSSDTALFVEEHLRSCPACREELKNLDNPSAFEGMEESISAAREADATPLKVLRKKLMMKKVQVVLFTAALVLSIVLSVVSVLTSPQFLPYTEGRAKVTENADGSIAIAFDTAVTGYEVVKAYNEDMGIEIWHVDAWNTVWDNYFTKRGTQNALISSDYPIAVYYSQNNGNEDVLLYGENPLPDGGVVTLPRFVLGYCLILAVLAIAGLAVVLFAVRNKETAKKWIFYILLLPASYILAHLCTKGLTVKSYSTQRDFGLIVLVAVIIYCAVFFGIGLYHSMKTARNRK